MAFGLDCAHLYVTGKKHMCFSQADQAVYWKDGDNKENLWRL